VHQIPPHSGKSSAPSWTDPARHGSMGNALLEHNEDVILGYLHRSKDVEKVEDKK